MSELEKQKKLLKDVNRILAHQKELERLRGEKFNIFSILKMETKENATHSAFLGELLNPKGSHLQGNTFLQLFLETIGYEEHNQSIAETKPIPKLNIETAWLKLEKDVGKTDVKNATGGRIDIYLVDKKGTSISIENKIYAGDQPAQIQRYVNHNKTANTVYYLTLNGTSASKESKGTLIEDEDYYCISYRSTIIEWLEKCLKEAVELPILRESIKQYILLIKKLTNQLTDRKMEKEITELIKSNYHSAKAIESAIWKVELKAAESFVKSITDMIKAELSEKEGWIVRMDKDLGTSWSGIDISHKNWDGVRVCLEGQSKIPWSNTIYGVHAHKGTWNRNQIKENLKEVEHLTSDFKETAHWPYCKTKFSFRSNEQRERLFNPPIIKELAESTADKMIILATQCKEALSKNTRIKK